MRRSRSGEIYRKHWLYPRLTTHLTGRTLDVGCGIGDMLRFLPSTVGVDINKRNVDHCNNLGLDARLMVPDELPFTNNEFDSVLLDNVLEHIAEPTQLLEEVRRVIKVDGTFIVGVPGILGWKSDLDHKVYYNESALIEKIEKFDFIHIKTLFMPLFKSELLSKIVRQYCIYVIFRRIYI